MKIKNFSWLTFFIGAVSGFVLGALCLGVFVNYVISNAISGQSTAGLPLSGAIEQAREGIANANAEKQAVSVYGHVVSIGAGTLVLEVSQIEGKKQLAFRYDNGTKFVSLANDAASTELPLSADTIVAGDGLNVFTQEPVGSVENQYAVKVIRI